VTLVTPRLEVRHPVEADRSRFVQLFGDAEFMAYSDGVLSSAEANQRFDRMVARCAEVPFAKQPIADRRRTSSRSWVSRTGRCLLWTEPYATSTC
jgi:[ribosomal protein S5]-alanine N-acetyltransferase